MNKYLFIFVVLLSGCANVNTSNDIFLDESKLENASADHLNLAILYLQQNKMAIALEEANKSLSFKPNNPDAFNARALIYMTAKENNKAEDDFIKSIKLAPTKSSFKNNYAWFLCYAKKDYNSALPILNDVLQDAYYETPTKAKLTLSYCYKEMGNLVDSNNVLQSLLNANSTDLDVLFQLLELSILQNDYDNFIKYKKQIKVILADSKVSIMPKQQQMLDHYK